MKTKSQSFSMLPIKRVDVFKETVERIKQYIEEYELEPGEKLPSERELAISLEVSRTSIRQAIKVLASMGVVETRIGSGTYVTNNNLNSTNPFIREGMNITKDFMKQLIVARAGTERIVFEAAVENISLEHIGELRQLLDENAKDLEGSIDVDEGGLDLSFEAKVAEIVGNDILIKMQQNIHELWVWSWRQFGYVPDRKEVLHNEHLEIIDALEKFDKELVQRLITEHVQKDIV